MKKTLLYIFIFACIEVFLGLVLGILFKFIPMQIRPENALQLTITTGLANILIIAIFLWRRWCPVSRNYIRTRPWATLIWSALLAIGMIIPLAWLEEFIPESWRTDIVGPEILSMLQSTEGYFVICMLAPLAEEIVFRGAIIRALRSWLTERRGMTEKSSAWAAIVISAVLFACIHFNPAQMPHAFIVGILLGWLFVKTGSIVPGIIIHWINNSSAYVMVKMFPLIPYDAPIEQYLNNNQIALVQAVICSLLIFIPSLYQLSKK